MFVSLTSELHETELNLSYKYAVRAIAFSLIALRQHNLLFSLNL